LNQHVAVHGGLVIGLGLLEEFIFEGGQLFVGAVPALPDGFALVLGEYCLECRHAVLPGQFNHLFVHIDVFEEGRFELPHIPGRIHVFLQGPQAVDPVKVS
jgi:hypothetical protein